MQELKMISRRSNRGINQGIRQGISRRRFLRGMMAGGLVTVQLPLLEMFLQ